MSTKRDITSALASVDALSSAGEEKRNTGHVFTALLFAVFIMVLLIGIIAGTKVYNSLNTIQTSANNSRLGVSLLANTIRGNDAASAVATGEGPEGRSLVLREVLESGTYETRIYLYQGNVVQEYTLEGSAYTPERATQIVASDTFSFSYESGLLTVTCDQGTSQIALRSLKGGA